MTGYKGVHMKGELSLLKLLKSVKEKPGFQSCGAIATFIGVVRGEAPDSEKVEKLELEAYEEEANRIFGGICEELKKREGIFDVQIHHFVGEFSVGEDLVYVVVAGTHRENVFGVLREAVERYKHEAPVFKKEYVVDKAGISKDAYWVSEREAQEKRERK